MKLISKVDAYQGPVQSVSIEPVNSGYLNFAGPNYGGPSGYVDTSNFADNLPALSVSFWVNTTVVDATNGYTVFISKMFDSHSSGWFIIIGETGRMIFGLYDADQANGIQNYPLNNVVINDGVWHNLVCTADISSATTHVYLDGVDISLQDNYGTLVSYSSPCNVIIGDACNPLANGNYVGLMDDVRIYSRVLTAAEALVISQKGDPSATGLEALWRCNEGSGTTLVDSSGNGRNGTLVGTVSFVAPPSFWQLLQTNPLPGIQVLQGLTTTVPLDSRGHGHSEDIIPAGTNFAILLLTKGTDSNNNPIDGFNSLKQLALLGQDWDKINDNVGGLVFYGALNNTTKQEFQALMKGYDQQYH